jgi:hypothetical protein
MDDIALIEGDDAPRAPWNTGRLEGVIDFPELHVAPGSRRGFAHDEPVSAFLDALSALEEEIGTRLAEEERRRAESHKVDVARQIRRAFRSVVRNLSDYDFFGVRGGDGHGGEETDRRATHPSASTAGALDSDTRGEPIEAAGPGTETDPVEAPGDLDAAEDTLFPPGPLARLELHPKRLRIPALATRGLRVRALDADGRPCAGPVDYSWDLRGPGEVEGEGARARYTASEIGDETESVVRVVAVQADTRLEAEAPVQIIAGPGAEARLQGIPEPQPVGAPGQSWRSRLRDGHWEYNDAHRDYLSVASDEPRRLRYLVHLLAKELVLRNFGRPGDAEGLERMVEILTHLDSGRKR